jgi:hypothetical protein
MGEVKKEFEFTRENLGKKVAEEFLSLKWTMDELKDDHLCTLEMSDFYRFAERAALDGNPTELKRCIEFVERAFTQGDANIVDAVHVSFLEYISEDSVMYNALSPKLRKAWDLAWRESK